MSPNPIPSYSLAQWIFLRYLFFWFFPLVIFFVFSSFYRVHLEETNLHERQKTTIVNVNLVLQNFIEEIDSISKIIDLHNAHDFLILSHIRESFNLIDSIYILDQSKKILHATSKNKQLNFKGFDMSGSPIAVQSDTPEVSRWTSVYTSTITGQLVIGYVFSLASSHQGVIEVNLEGLNSLIKTKLYEENLSKIFILDANDNFLIHAAQPQLVNQRANIQSQVRGDFVSHNFPSFLPFTFEDLNLGTQLAMKFTMPEQSWVIFVSEPQLAFHEKLLIEFLLLLSVFLSLGFLGVLLIYYSKFYLQNKLSPLQTFAEDKQAHKIKDLFFTDFLSLTQALGQLRWEKYQNQLKENRDELTGIAN